MAAPIVKPEPIRRNGFQYDGTFMTIDGVAYERPQHLLRLCYPSEPEKWKIKLGRGRPPKMEKITDLEATRTLSRKFMLAQFRFYGLPPPYQSSADEVLAIFRDQVTAGNVREGPACPPSPPPSSAGCEKHVRLARTANLVPLQFRKMAADVEKLRDDMIAEWETRRDTSLQRPRGRPKGSTRKVEDPIPATVVGAYVITSKEIQDQWSVNGNLTLDVAPTSTLGVYKGTFHFGVVVGVMILSADEKLLVSHMRRLDAGDDPDRQRTNNAAEDLAAAGNKRKQPPNGAGRRGELQQAVPGKKARTAGAVGVGGAAAGQPGMPPIGTMPPGMAGMPGMPGMPGMAQTANMGGLGGLGALVGGAVPMPGGSTQPSSTPAPAAVPFQVSGRPPLKFYVRWRGRGLVENNMQTGEHRGTLKFTNKHYTKFAGEMDLAFLGADEITGKRVSDVPTLSGESWSDYLETVYDWTRGNRWN